MLLSSIYSIIGLGILEQLVTASPLRPAASNAFDSKRHESHIRARQDEPRVRWPSQLIEWPFPANTSNPNDTVPILDPDTSKDDEVYARSEISKAFIQNSCSQIQRQKILEAWRDARVLVDAQTTFQSGFDYNIPHTHWLGWAWNSVDPDNRIDYGKIIRENFSRLRLLFSNDAPKHDYIYFYCSDPHKMCTDDPGKGRTMLAYQWSSTWWWPWTNHYINFCPPWYNLRTLNQVKREAKQKPWMERIINFFEYTRDTIMLHEIWHMEYLVSKPRVVDITYGAQRCWDLARYQSTYWCRQNADSYKLDAVAIHIQQHFNSRYSPIPWEALRTVDPKAFAESEAPPQNNYTTLYLGHQNNTGLLGALSSKIPELIGFDEITYDLWPDTQKPDPVEQPPPDPVEQPPPDPAEQPPSDPTKTLAILGEWKTDPVFQDGIGQLDWLFYQRDFGKGVGCDTDTVNHDDTTYNPLEPIYPQGVKNMKLWDVECQYMPEEGQPGKLKCGDLEVQCTDDPANTKEDKGEYVCGDNTRQPVFLCSW